MKKAEKEQLVTALRDKLKSAQSLYYTDFTGLNVKRMTELRRRLKRAGVDYVVIKNTLALRAVNESGLVGSKLSGPTGLVVGKDPVAAARVLTEFAKEFEDRPAMKGGMLQGKAIDNAQLKRMASGCGASIPDWMAGHFDGLDGDPDTRRLVAASLAAEQCRRLHANGVHEFHFYTLNRADLIVAICHLLGVRAARPAAAIA